MRCGSVQNWGTHDTADDSIATHRRRIGRRLTSWGARMIWWNSWSEFVAMGGYGLYVWGSFGVTTAVIAVEIWAIGASRRALSQEHALQREVDFGEPT